VDEEIKEVGLVVHTCNPSTQEADCEFETSWGFIEIARLTWDV
jgi:hypothetical protein